jgi:hypothetical protein
MIASLTFIFFFFMTESVTSAAGSAPRVCASHLKQHASAFLIQVKAVLKGIVSLTRASLYSYEGFAFPFFQEKRII